jgi:phasin
MDKNTTTTPTKPVSSPMTDAPQVFREMAEEGTKQAKEAHEKMSAATTEAADLIKNSYSIVVKGTQDYNEKFIEFTQVNAQAAFDFVQKLSESPSAFVELSTEHARNQLETLTEQIKQLAAIAQKVTLATAEPFKSGVAKAFNQAA